MILIYKNIILIIKIIVKVRYLYVEEINISNFKSIVISKEIIYNAHIKC